MPFTEITKEIVLPNTPTPIFLSYYIKNQLKRENLPQKFLIFSPNLIFKNHEKKELENSSVFEIVAFSRPEESDDLHQEIFEEMKEIYTKFQIKTRYTKLHFLKYCLKSFRTGF